MRRRLVLMLGLTALLVGLVPSVALAVSTPHSRPASGPFIPRSRVTASAAAPSSLGAVHGLQVQATIASPEFDTVQNKALGAVASAGMLSSDVTIPNYGTYYWSGDYLHVDGWVENNSASALDYGQVHIRLETLSGGVIDEETNYVHQYVIAPGDSATFGASFYLPGLAGSDLNVIVSSWGVEPAYSETEFLTLVGRTVEVVDGLRVFSCVFRNDSPYTVTAPLVGGWEWDSNDELIDTLFAYEDINVPPGGLWAKTTVGFNPYALPASVETWCQARRVVSYTITPSAGANGSISPNTVQTVNSGASSTFNITPAAGHRIEDVLVDGVSVGAVGSYTFTNVMKNQTISARFALDPLTVATSTRLSGPPSVKVKKTLKFFGMVSPRGPGTVTITAQRKVGRKWKSAGHGHASVVGGAYRYSFKPKNKGSWRFVASYSGGVDGNTIYTGSKSGYKNVRVK